VEFGVSSHTRTLIEHLFDPPVGDGRRDNLFMDDARPEELTPEEHRRLRRRRIVRAVIVVIVVVAMIATILIPVIVRVVRSPVPADRVIALHAPVPCRRMGS